MSEEPITEDGEVVDNIPDVDPELQAVEDRARRQGWRPKEEYRGDPSRWVDARTFVLRGEAELPILRERFRKIDTEFSATRTELNDVKKKLTEATEVLVEFRDMSRNAEQRAYDRAKDELRQRQREAVQEASPEKFDAAQRQIDALPQPAPVPPKRPEPVAAAVGALPPGAGPDPVTLQWINDNPWFNIDRPMHDYALYEDREIKMEFPGWSVAEQLAEVRQRTMDKFPEKFGNTRRRTPSAVAASAAPLPKTKGKTVKDLPDDAKAALERFKKQIPGYKEQEYLDMYFAGETD